MSQACSISARRVYGLARVCRLWRVARSTVYDARRRRELEELGQTPRPRKRGPVGACTDEELAGHIRRVIETCPWVGEGYRKVRARLRFEGIRTGKKRVLRTMREHGLLAPTRLGRRHGPKAHDGTIVPERPDELWGTDMTTTLTGEGQASIFFVIDHGTAECLGIHAALRGTRFEALEPLRQAAHRRRGAFAPGILEKITMRHDHGSQFVSYAYQEELRFLGMESSPAYVREPQGNGCAERFVRTLKEQLLWLRRFATLEELQRALLDFMERYNRGWLIQRHGWLSPAEQYRRLTAHEVAA